MKVVMKQLSILTIAVLLLSGFLRFHHHDSAGISHAIVSELIHHSLYHSDSEHNDCGSNNLCHHHQGKSSCNGDCTHTINIIDQLYNSFNNGFVQPCQLSVDRTPVYELSSPIPVYSSIGDYLNPYIKHLRRRGPPCFIV